MDRLIVLGGGESGVGAAILGKVKGYDVLVSDSGTLKDEYRQELERAGIAFEEGGHTENKVMAADLAIKSPGIPETAPVVVALREKGVPVISEIEFAGRYTKARKIGITGANGKTTTTLLTHHILSECGIKASLAGNVGFSMARQVAKGDEPDWYVIELSSFQLDDMFDFKCDVAILCNITPDHMDRYDHSLANYAHAKYRITQNMTKDEVFIYNADDLGTLTYFNNPAATCVPVSTIGRSRYANCHNGQIDIRLDENDGLCVGVDELPIPGRHNVYNCMMALSAVMATRSVTGGRVSIDAESIKSALKTFRNAHHRLEPVRTLDGVTYVNDSKATNVDAAWYALDAQKSPIVWIAGGKDKGNDYSVLNDLCREKVRALVCLGKDNTKLKECFSGVIETIVDTHDIATCVAECRKIAKAGDVVLLSPCCASFDLFTSYENRGDLFREEVEKL